MASLKTTHPRYDAGAHADWSALNDTKTCWGCNAHANGYGVVITSSCAAIYGDNADVAKAPGGRLDEIIWNTSSSLDFGAYSYSKTLAEKEVWEIAAQQDQWTFVAINPGLVLGPALQDNPTSESFNIVRQMGDGTMNPGAPRWSFGVVDVRDLAQTHIAAGFEPTANGRNIIVGHKADLFEMSQLLKAKFGAGYPLPARALPKWLVWLVAPFACGGMTRQIVARSVGVEWHADNSKAKRALGVTYRPLQTSMEEMFQQMIDSRFFKKA